MLSLLKSKDSSITRFFLACHTNAAPPPCTSLRAQTGKQPSLCVHLKSVQYHFRALRSAYASFTYEEQQSMYSLLPHPLDNRNTDSLQSHEDPTIRFASIPNLYDIHVGSPYARAQVRLKDSFGSGH